MAKYLVFLLSIFSAAANSQQLPFQFDAKAILVLSDADMVASAYVDGKLKTQPGVEDALTLITAGKRMEDFRTRQIKIPNSVTNWVNALDISRDGTTAFVVDTRGSLPRSTQQVKNVFDDLPAGNTLYAIDIRDIQKPKMIDSLKVGATPLSVSINPIDGLILICGAEKGKEIILAAFKNNKLGVVKTYAQEGKVTHANWHPSGNYFGVTLENTKQVQFYKMQDDGSAIPSGKPVVINGLPGAAIFTPNGKFYVVPNLNWDKGYDKKGELVAVAFDEAGNHSIASTTEVGVSPEGIAVNSKGTMIAVSNMGTMFMPVNIPFFGKSASVSLLSLNAETGAMQVMDTKEWEGILPEGIAFDNDGDMLATTSFDYLDLTERRGGVHFWKVEQNGSSYRLQNTGFKLTVQRGAHYIKLLR